VISLLLSFSLTFLLTHFQLLHSPNRFLKNFTGHNSPINALAVNEDGVAVSCGDNGSIEFWDYETGYCFQKSSTIVQPGSLDAECGIYAAGFDLSGR
jgi:pleiotropic regulator 1